MKERSRFEEEREMLSNFLSNPTINVWLGERRKLVDVNDFDKKLNFFKDIVAENLDNKRLREVFSRFLKYEEQQSREQKKGFRRTHNLTQQDVEKELKDTKQRLSIRAPKTKVDLLFRSEVVRRGLSRQEQEELKRRLVYHETEDQKEKERERAYELAIKELRRKNCPEKKIYDRKESAYFDLLDVTPQEL